MFDGFEKWWIESKITPSAKLAFPPNRTSRGCSFFSSASSSIRVAALYPLNTNEISSERCEKQTSERQAYFDCARIILLHINAISHQISPKLSAFFFLGCISPSKACYKSTVFMLRHLPRHSPSLLYYLPGICQWYWIFRFFMWAFTCACVCLCVYSPHENWMVPDWTDLLWKTLGETFLQVGKECVLHFCCCICRKAPL